MEKTFWHQMWTENDIEFNQSQVNPHLKEFWPSLHLKHKTRIFVPLCGKSIDMLWLLEQGHVVIGVELSAIACQAFFDEHHLAYTHSVKGPFECYAGENITLWCGDFFELNPKLIGPIDAVYDRAALIALPPAMRATYSQKMLELNQGPILLMCVSYDQNEMSGPPFSVPEKEVHQLYQAQYDIKPLLNEDFTQIPERFRQRGLTQASEQIYLLNKTP